MNGIKDFATIIIGYNYIFKNSDNSDQFNWPICLGNPSSLHLNYLQRRLMN